MNLTSQEVALIDLIRAKKYTRIEILMKNGAFSRIYVDEEISPAAANMEDLIHSNGFQTITITEHGGDLVRIKRTIPIKF